ncbi:MAG: ligase-associated DNA damage response endonuclease PdeM [Verrucomicrobiales bacterium]
MTAIDFLGHPLHLLPSGAAYAAESRALFIADPHFAKSAVFRNSGLGVPDGSDASVLARIETSLVRTSADTLIILGDVFHARAARMEATLAVIADWREKHPVLKWIIVPGNHDRSVPWSKWLPGAEILEEGTMFGPWRLAHHPPESSDVPLLCGHLHPGISFGPARQRKVKAPCFWQRRGVLVLPAIGEFTGLGMIAREDGDRVWLAAGEQVLELPPG